MTIRLENIQCWSCNNLSDFTIEIPEDHVFSVYCGICEKENVIDLNPHKKREEVTFRGSTDTQTTHTRNSGNYDFPNPILGTKPTSQAS